ncbi:MAG: hypothetical protein WAK93_09500 [Solirubrobacteraceae bacterium]
MRAQTPIAVPPLPAAPAIPVAARRRSGLDGYEIALLALFGALSLWVVAIDVWSAIEHGRVWTGTDGFFIVDQMQYLSWIQSASQHLLISNMFVLRPTPSDYFQPAIAISGAITALGVAPWLSLLLWKPVAVVATFLGLRAVVYRSLSGKLERRAAITLGLLFGSFTVVYGSFGIIGDMMPVWQSWGYPFGLIAVALVAFGLLGYERARAGGRIAWLPGVMGAVASTLHPWQGELMILVVAGAELVRWRENLGWVRRSQWQRLALPALTIVLVAAPLLYYDLLGHLDLSWNLARQASKHTFSFWSIAIGAAPLALFAALGYRGRPDDFFELLLRVWAPATILIYFVSGSSASATPLHAVNGITLPLAVLAVKGVRRSGLRRMPRVRLVAGVAILLGTVPANAYALAVAHNYTKPTGGNANFISHDEKAALSYLAHDPVAGGVMTQFYLGEAVPGRTGRKTFVGDCLWSEPNCMPRSLSADALFEGKLSPAASQRFVRRSGARFLLASCNAPDVNLRRKLGALFASVRHFGCAAVYELQPPTPAAGPLAELPPNAAVRAPRRQ